MQAGYNIPCLGIATPAGSLFSIPGSGIDESVISGSRDTAGIIDWQKYQHRRRKIVGFHYRAITSVHLANKNSIIETKVQLNSGINCLHIKKRECDDIL